MSDWDYVLDDLNCQNKAMGSHGRLWGAFILSESDNGKQGRKNLEVNRFELFR